MVRNHLVAVGAFVVFGVLLFAVGLFLIGDRRMLFNDTFEVYAEFSNVAGLQIGAKVRVGGMDAGEVKMIHVPPTPSARFRVQLRIREDLHRLIRVDSVASIQNDGLVGNKFVQVEAGTDQAQVVPPGGTVKSHEPFDLGEMLQRMSQTVDLITKTIGDLKTGVEQALGAVSATANEAQSLITDVGKDARDIMVSTQKVTEDLNLVISAVKEGRGTVGKLLTDDALYVSAKKMAAEAEQTVATLREASQQAKEAVADFRGENGPLKGMTGSLQQTLASARDAMTDLAENAEALKHNFLFRGFFNRRGYFDLGDISVQQYRQGALQMKDRRVLRIWAAAGVLFEKDANGRERLGDGGKVRLDSAMAQFVQYPKSPFVVEGYAQEPTNDARYLVSRARAQLVRDYVVGKFGLDTKFVVVMPMGAEADGSPSGDRWDGVALAMFVPRSSTKAGM
jgi:phospholipid/cholesterol/gamma-HCH transport system substrate-binding protein